VERSWEIKNRARGRSNGVLLKINLPLTMILTSQEVVMIMVKK